MDTARVAPPLISGRALRADYSYLSNLSNRDSTAVFWADRNRILAILAGQTEFLRSGAHEGVEVRGSLSASRVDALIQQYAIEVHNLAKDKNNPYLASAPLAEPGTMFSIYA